MWRRPVTPVAAVWLAAGTVSTATAVLLVVALWWVPPRPVVREAVVVPYRLPYDGPSAPTGRRPVPDLPGVAR